MEKAFHPYKVIENSERKLVVVERSISAMQLLPGFFVFIAIFAFINIRYAIGLFIICGIISYFLPKLAKRVVHTFTFEPGKITISCNKLFGGNKVEEITLIQAIRPAPFFLKTWFVSVEMVLTVGGKRTLLSYGGVSEDLAKQHSAIIADSIAKVLGIVEAA
jgi:hypothetical protein